MENWDERRPESEGVFSADGLTKERLVSERLRRNEGLRGDDFVAGIAASITWEW